MKREIWVTIVIVIIIFIIIMSSPATSVVSSSLKSLQTHFRLWCAIIYQPSADHSLADADAATTHVSVKDWPWTRVVLRGNTNKNR